VSVLIHLSRRRRQRRHLAQDAAKQPLHHLTRGLFGGMLQRIVTLPSGTAGAKLDETLAKRGRLVYEAVEIRVSKGKFRLNRAKQTEIPENIASHRIALVWCANEKRDGYRSQ
jgi:hypothetical protein